MRLRYFELPVILSFAIGFSFASPTWAAQQPSLTIPVSVVVSVEAKHGKDVPSVTRDDVSVFRGRDRLKVTGWIPLQGSQSGLGLLILIDEGSGLNVASQFGDIRNFMNSQPDSTAIAIGYMQNGSVRMTQNFTKDHAAAGKALQIPGGPGFGGNSPYLSISDAIKHWPESGNRRAIFMISDGIDPLQSGYYGFLSGRSSRGRAASGHPGLHNLCLWRRPFRTHALEDRPGPAQSFRIGRPDRRRRLFSGAGISRRLCPIPRPVCGAAQTSVQTDVSCRTRKESDLPAREAGDRSAECGAGDRRQSVCPGGKIIGADPRLLQLMMADLGIFL